MPSAACASSGCSPDRRPVTYFAVTAVGTDRPGIVAGVTGAFARLGCNLEDSSMTILRGQFAMMLVVDAPAGVGAGELEAALAGPAADLDLVVTVRPAPEPAEEAEVDASWTVSVYGADHPGIVHGVAALLAELATRKAKIAEKAKTTQQQQQQ